jgi:hypothetical protein
VLPTPHPFHYPYKKGLFSTEFIFGSPYHSSGLLASGSGIINGSEQMIDAT